MIETTLIVLALISFPLVAFISRRSHRRANHAIEYFTLGLRDRNSFSIAAGISMAFVGGAATINMASLGYQYGWSVFIDPVVVFCALLISAYFAKRVRDGHGLTISELLTDSSPPLKLFLGLTSFFVYQLLTAAQFVAV